MQSIFGLADIMGKYTLGHSKVIPVLEKPGNKVGSSRINNTRTGSQSNNIWRDHFATKM